MSDLEKIKADLLLKASLEDIAKGERDRKIGRGVSDIPVKKIIDAVDYIDKQLLPAIRKKSGESSADFEFFQSVQKHLLYCIAVTDRYEYLQGRYVRLKVEHQLTLEHLQLMERELEKYNALEDLYLTDALDLYAQRVKDAARDRMNRIK